MPLGFINDFTFKLTEILNQKPKRKRDDQTKQTATHFRVLSSMIIMS